MSQNSGDYRIIKQEWFNKYGKSQKSYYYIQKKKRFLFLFSSWQYVKELPSTMTSRNMIRLCFQNIEAAQDYINEVLLRNLPTETWSHTILKNQN